MRNRSSDAADLPPPADLARRSRAGFLCALASFIVALIAAFFATGIIPGRTSGEAMLLLIFVTSPLAFAGFLLSIRDSRRSGRRGLPTAGIYVALFVLLSAILVVALVYLSWTRCANSCV
ncbi:MAG TPA: hypothetical protein VJN88_02500 [Ktedonobacterales bacterium]|nr:hypothetical protein [Ktedonobacterales bacterium]